jgi:hypothetical protein
MTETPNQPDIGEELPDGTVYAGPSPKNGQPMYVNGPTPVTFSRAEAEAAINNLAPLGWRLPSNEELQKDMRGRALTSKDTLDLAQQELRASWADASPPSFPKTYEGSLVFKKDAPITRQHAPKVPGPKT